VVPRNFSPEERFEAGVASCEAGSDWFRARDEYFQPLVSADPDKWQERVEPYLQEIQRHELQAGLNSGRVRRLKNRTPAGSEPERFLNLAQHYYETGDVAGAEHTLSALRSLLKDEPKYETVLKMTEALLDDLRGNHFQQPDRDTFLKNVMDRAQRLHDAGNKTAAREIWAGMVELYGTDPGAGRDVELAKKKLNEDKTAGP
jgi:hypothetical protein